jgi:hypothetical protein
LHTYYLEMNLRTARDMQMAKMPYCFFVLKGICIKHNKANKPSKIGELL